jgi:hypothetical protein
LLETTDKKRAPDLLGVYNQYIQQKVFAMRFHTGPEFIEVLQSIAEDRPADYTAEIVSDEPHAFKSKDHLTRLQHVASRLRSLVIVVVASEWILLLICACMLFC